jgi:signal transduction histidine kinase
VTVFVLCAVATLVLVATLATSASRDDANMLSARTQPVIEYTAADFSFSASATIPGSGWQRGPLPDFKLLAAARAHGLDPPRFWARIGFDRSMFGTRPIALYSEMVRDSFVIYLNGAEIYRSRGEASDTSFGWNHPQFIPLPPSLLRGGVNEIVFRVETLKPNLLGLGSLRVGPDRAVRAKYDKQYFLSNTAPQIVSGYLLIITIGALSLWIRRPQERVYGWLALVGAMWIFRNLHYFLQDVPIGRELFWIATTDSIFMLSAVVFGFAVNYFRLANARLLYVLIFSACAVQIVLRNALISSGRSEMPAFLLAIPLTIAMIVMWLRACQRAPSTQNWTMFGAITLAMFFGLHDMLFSFNISKGAGFYLQPYGGLLMFAAFDIALTSRLQTALIDVEDVNLKLEARVAEVTEGLEQSEAARAELQIALAVDGERERIMREIHDGIGSSLLTALTSAKRRNESPETIATLSRSLTDLRIGVDSLEPIGGDVVALLANLRHRMERELKGAGVTFIWKVNHAPALPWLDPIGALHILRILQEAIGNALIHADAAGIEVSCDAHDDEGVAGVLIEIGDRGGGFDLHDASPGKGLANMAARAEAISAKFWCKSEAGRGTTIALWLPLTRAALEV